MIKKLFRLMLVVAFALSSSMFVSCENYDDDIKRLDDAVASLQATIQTLQSEISAGALITDVTNTADGVKVTMNNGKSFTVNNGKDGEDATVWTIGADGFWYQDGAKTEFVAVGAAGANGKYYVPNATTGNFDIYQDGKFVEATNILWKVTATGSNVILSGNTLKFIDADGKEVASVALGTPLGSVAFVPDVMDNATSLPTLKTPFYTIPGYAENAEENLDYTYNGVTYKDMYALKNFDKSNERELLYRLNPTNAYVNGATVAFVNRNLETRADENPFGDITKLMNVVGVEFGTSGDATVTATYNRSKELDDYDIAALQVWAGQNPVTSDYIRVTDHTLSTYLVNTQKTVVGTSVSQYRNRWLALPTAATETDAFVKIFMRDVEYKFYIHHNLKYDAQLDLKPLVKMYGYKSNPKIHNYLDALGFTGITYEFSKPKEYLANDDKKTNQQDYITLTDGVVAVNPEYKTSAVDRTPVIRVDAYALDNYGVKTLIKSAYIKIQITLEEVAVEDKAANNVTISDAKSYNYRTLTSDYKALVGDMSWQRVSKEVYDVEGLTSANFWDYYGGANDEYDIVVSVGGKVLDTWSGVWTNGAANLWTSTATGIQTQINLNKTGQQTSYVKVAVNNSIKTQHTYATGANYKVVITIKSDNKKVHGDFVFTQEFSVADECRQYTFNELYHFDQNSSWAALAGITSNDIIVVKGQLNSSNTWEMSSVVSEHFANVDGKNIFTYYNTDKYVTNVNAIEFCWTKQPDTEVTPAGVQTADYTIALAKAMDKAYIVKNMTLTQTLVNGEECETDYDVVFVNPFKAGASSPLAVYANGVGERTVSVLPEVLVIDNEDDPIYKYDATSKTLVLTDKAKNDYKVAAPSVAYKLDVTEADYKTVSSQMSAGSVLAVDATTGEFTWKNEGATLTKDYTVTVVATVTFANLSVVECRIPVKLSATKLP